MAGLPDSLDIVSLWNNSKNLTEKQKKDLAFVQQVKGTKVVVCQIIGSVGDGFTPSYVTDNWEENGYGSDREAINAFGDLMKQIRRLWKLLFVNMQEQ